jgi:prepilin-type N-terminal cleavage/methylation domain-containing protein
MTSQQKLDGARRFAFTLIELLIVIAIVAILTALLLPVLSQAKARAQSVKCLSNLLHQVGLGLKMYMDDNKQTYPAARSSQLDPLATPDYSHGFALGGQRF